MTDNERYELARDLLALAVFRDIIKEPAMKALIWSLECKIERERTQFLGDMVYYLQDHSCSLSAFLKNRICASENAYIIRAANGEDIPLSLSANVKAELELFTKLTQLSASDICSGGPNVYLPQFENTATDFVAMYEERVANVRKYGYGIFSQSCMFRVDGGDIVPVKAADDIALDSFIGYEEQRGKVFDNTKALISGAKAANILLFGDAGTGKSSTVKACANHFACEGVRLIELRRDQLSDIAFVMDRISGNPLKFIIFIDDLSFNKNDDSFSMLKAALEGSASAKADNAVIYATSNRRHIVKESFSDRSASDDIHRNDTMQELMSLSDRFGLTVYFEKPGKQLYLEIVDKLAEKNGISRDRPVLFEQAEAFALRKGNRSPRAAEQFINNILSEVNNYE